MVLTNFLDFLQFHYYQALLLDTLAYIYQSTCNQYQYWFFSQPNIFFSYIGEHLKQENLKPKQFNNYQIKRNS